MLTGTAHTGSGQKTTVHTAVVPFYGYAALSFLAATFALFLSAEHLGLHYFMPQVLAVTHLFTLGWGTMVILGASHQLVPVLLERGLYSNRLALFSFATAATGIPLLVHGFYMFSFRPPMMAGGILVLLSFLLFFINLWMSFKKAAAKNVHAVFVLTASGWLLFTAVAGLLLIFHIAKPFLPRTALQYLSLHAHAGIGGWFLLLITGVGSRLVPMFLISKYKNVRLLWVLYALINAGMICMLLVEFSILPGIWRLLPVILVAVSVFLFLFYCVQSWRMRIRKKTVDEMKLSFFSFAMMPLAVFLLFFITGSSLSGSQMLQWTILYGFLVICGWVTALILGMTFKTLPFIIWNKVYKARAGVSKTPAPVELYSKKIFRAMAVLFISAVAVCSGGLILLHQHLVQAGAGLLVLVAIAYCINVWNLVFHKPRLV